MPENQEKQSQKEPKFVPSQTPTTSTDFINIGISESGTLLLQLISAVPGYAFENHRTVVSSEFVNVFIDNLCEITDYYPTKPKKRSKKK